MLNIEEKIGLWEEVAQILNGLQLKTLTLMQGMTRKMGKNWGTFQIKVKRNSSVNTNLLFHLCCRSPSTQVSLSCCCHHCQVSCIALTLFVRLA